MWAGFHKRSQDDEIANRAFTPMTTRGSFVLVDLPVSGEVEIR